MAYYGRIGAAPRIVALLLLILVLLAGGALWFDYLGLLDVKDVISPVIRFFGFHGRTKLEGETSPLLLDAERLGKLREALGLQAEEMLRAEEGLKSREEDIHRKAAELDERRKSLEDQEKSFNERVRLYDNKSANIEQNARYLTGMPPAQAVAILVKMDDQDMIDHLRMVEKLAVAAGEESIVSFWLSLMPSDRAAVIQRKMAVKPRS